MSYNDSSFSIQNMILYAFKNTKWVVSKFSASKVWLECMWNIAYIKIVTISHIIWNIFYLKCVAIFRIRSIGWLKTPMSIIHNEYLGWFQRRDDAILSECSFCLFFQYFTIILVKKTKTKDSSTNLLYLFKFKIELFSTHSNGFGKACMF